LTGGLETVPIQKNGGGEEDREEKDKIESDILANPKGGIKKKSEARLLPILRQNQKKGKGKEKGFLEQALTN